MTIVTIAMLIFIGIIGISRAFAQWAPYTYNPGYGYFPGGYYGSSVYSEPVSFWVPVLGSILPHPRYLPPPETTLPLPGTPIPREIIKLAPFGRTLNLLKSLTFLLRLAENPHEKNENSYAIELGASSNCFEQLRSHLHMSFRIKD